MKYLNLPSSINQHEFMLKATPEQKGVWFDLVCYCHQQMNGGMIGGALDYPDHVMQRIAGVPTSYMLQDCPLWHFSGKELLIHFYDSKAEDDFKRKQRTGKEHAKKRWGSNSVKNG